MAAVPEIVQYWKNFECPDIGKWLDKLGHTTDNEILCIGKKKKKKGLYELTWTDFQKSKVII